MTTNDKATPSVEVYPIVAYPHTCISAHLPNRMPYRQSNKDKLAAGAISVRGLCQERRYAGNYTSVLGTYSNDSGGVKW